LLIVQKKRAGLVSGSFFLKWAKTIDVFKKTKKLQKNPNVVKKQQMYFFYKNNCIRKKSMYNLYYQCKVDTL